LKLSILLHSIIEHDNTLEPCLGAQTVFNQQSSSLPFGSELSLPPSEPSDESSCARMKSYPALTRKRFFVYFDRDTAEAKVSITLF
jgi:hypothetical protein